MNFNPWLLLTFVILLVYFVYKSLRELYTTIERLGIPGPRPVWIFGNVLDFKDRDVLSVFKEWRGKFGNIYGFYEGFRPGIVINDPEVAKEVLVTKFGLFHCRTNYRPFMYYPTNRQVNIETDFDTWKSQRGVTEKVLNFTGNMKQNYRPFMYYPTNRQVNIETDFDTWKSQRGVTEKVLNFTGNMKQVMQKLHASSESFLSCIETIIQASAGELDICGPTFRFTSEAILRLMLDFKEKELSEYHDTFYDYEMKCTHASSTENEIAGLARLFPSLTPILQLADGEHKRSHQTILQLLKSHIQNKIKEQKSDLKMESNNDDSILSNLLSAKLLSRDIDGSNTRRSLVPDEIISQLLLFLSETYHTTASMIQFMLYELACNPECQEKLYDDVIDTCGETGSLDYRDLKSLEYFDMVCNEAYRLHPIAPGLSRVAACDCTVAGYPIKEGMPVRIMTCTLYQDDSIFPEPQKFDPERFNSENLASRHACTFLPFGMGPRVCPGVKLAHVIVKSVVITLLRQYKLSVNTHTQIPLKHALRPSICPADGVHITLTTRHSGIEGHHH